MKEQKTLHIHFRTSVDIYNSKRSITFILSLTSLNLDGNEGS